LFHGVRKGLLFELISMGMVDLHARPLHRIALVQRAGRCNATAQTSRTNAATANGGSVRKLPKVLREECANGCPSRTKGSSRRFHFCREAVTVGTNDAPENRLPENRPAKKNGAPALAILCLLKIA
jgi:hypothetical protein